MTEFNSTSDAYKYIYNLSLKESSFRYRGQASFGWSLMPSIHRYTRLHRYQTVKHEEFLMLQKPKEPNPPLTHTTYDLEWLMLCQHHGIPTRLLDWSSDILIGLLFACSDKSKMNDDGALFICNMLDYPTYTFDEPLKEEQNLSFASTSVTNPRMRTQSGSFMIWGLSPLSNDSKESYDLWQYLKNTKEDSFLEKIRIPKASKRRILYELSEIYSITMDSIYLKSGFIEKNFGKSFLELKENLRLMTLYQTDADRLTKEEEIKARNFFSVECRNMYHRTISLSKY